MLRFYRQLINTNIKQEDTFHINLCTLSIELLYMVLNKLNTETWLILRNVNHFFGQLITNDYLWKCQYKTTYKKIKIDRNKINKISFCKDYAKMITPHIKEYVITWNNKYFIKMSQRYKLIKNEYMGIFTKNALKYENYKIGKMAYYRTPNKLNIVADWFILHKSKDYCYVDRNDFIAIYEPKFGKLITEFKISPFYRLFDTDDNIIPYKIELKCENYRKHKTKKSSTNIKSAIYTYDIDKNINKKLKFDDFISNWKIIKSKNYILLQDFDDRFVLYNLNSDTYDYFDIPNVNFSKKDKTQISFIHPYIFVNNTNELMIIDTNKNFKLSHIIIPCMALFVKMYNSKLYFVGINLTIFDLITMEKIYDKEINLELTKYIINKKFPNKLLDKTSLWSWSFDIIINEDIIAITFGTTIVWYEF